MKKNLIYIQIVLWTVIVIFGLGMLGYSIINEIRPDKEQVFSGDATYQVNQYTHKRDKVQGEFTIPSKDIEKISVDLVSEDVIVSIGNQKDIQVIHYANRKLDSNDQLQVDTSSNTLRISKKHTVRLFQFMPLQQVVEIKIPQDLLPQMKIDVVSGDINIEGNYDSLNVSTVSGEQELKAIQAKKIIQDTTSGDISLVEVSCNEYKAEAISGEVNVSFNTMPEEVSAKTVSGDIELTLPSNNGFELDYNTVSGDVESEFRIDWEYSKKTEGKGTYKSDTTKIVVETISGDIDINK